MPDRCLTVTRTACNWETAVEPYLDLLAALVRP